MQRLAVVAIGGNSLIRDRNRQEVEDQRQAVAETVEQIVVLIERGWQVVITHGNGPQVGFILRRSEIAYAAKELHFVPLKNCVADTQGAIGYQIQEALYNAFRQRGLRRSAVTVVTLVEVDAADPSFARPTKPIGTFYSAEKAAALGAEHPDWHFAAEGDRGLRRVVPSPLPRRIVELEAIRALVDGGFCVVAAGGGGIPAVAAADGRLVGVDAVVDKDRTSALLASGLRAEVLVISTAVDRVYRDFGRPGQTPIDRLDSAAARRLLEAGHFAAGSMLPKIEAGLDFLAHGGTRVIITNPENLAAAMDGRAGTHMTV